MRLSLVHTVLKTENGIICTRKFLQHACSLQKRKVSQKATHLALVKYFEKDLVTKDAPSEPADKSDTPIDSDEQFACPWMGVIVNIPTRLDAEGRSFGVSGSKLRNECRSRDFNPDRVIPLWNLQVAEDDASLVKHIGQSFRFSAVEAKREEQIQAAHEEAMFGVSSLPHPISTDSEPERENEKEADKKDLVSSLLSETVLAKQKGSWRDRVRRG